MFKTLYTEENPQNLEFLKAHKAELEAMTKENTK
jgi:hypothetical protein